ncbi:hypothetical protein [Pseudomonas sp. GWSMS-1]|uniref:hypothetical protein n=1 Tax=Pseudomonas sp. GWSMS-1 TaxID=3308997 RepID=UPI003CEB1FED
MKLPPIRPQHWLIFAVVAALFFAWGSWLMRPQPAAQPLPWLAQWQAEVLTPLADDRLSVVHLRDALEGELWLQPSLDGARLLYRGELQDGNEAWSLEAEVGLEAAERESLLAAAGLKPTDKAQPLGSQLLVSLANRPIIALTLLPPAPLDAARLAASIGQPRLTLELAEGQAWVYPELGMTAHLQDGELYFLYAVPRHLLKQR